MAKEVPVYLFFGFLEAGKTKFIQETFEDPRFDSGERTLLLVFEEGEEEYEPSRFAVEKYAIEKLPQEEMTASRLSAIVKKHRPDRVVVEYNGMRMLGDFFDAMPDGWMIAQIMTFFDSATFPVYNANMRQLVFDKIQYADLVVFNRFRKEDPKEAFHKIVRAVSRRPDIVYEYPDGRTEYDEIEDPLPYDLNAPVVTIEDRDFAYFYRDLVEETDKYEGKKVHFKGMVAMDTKTASGTFVAGRFIMTCCAADIRYSGLVCVTSLTFPMKTRDWVELTAEIHIEKHRIYGKEGPVLHVSELKSAVPLTGDSEVATFY